MTGDKQDIFSRLKKNMPPIFGDNTPVLDAVLLGLASGLSFVYTFIQYVSSQTRLTTSTGVFVDLFADTFTTLRRRLNESDQTFISRISGSIFQKKGTRKAIIKAVTDATGSPPAVIHVPDYPADCFCAGVGYLGVDRVGSYTNPYEAFVIIGTVVAPSLFEVVSGSDIQPVYSNGVQVGTYGLLTTPARSIGINSTRFGLNAEASLGDASNFNISSHLDILAAIDDVKVAGTKVWVNFQN